MPSEARQHRGQAWPNDFGLLDIDRRNGQPDESDLTHAFYCLLDDSELREVFADFMVGQMQVDGEDQQQDRGYGAQSASETSKAN